ncbi:hypothetical protein E2C01_002637 [Portunus trituberculatus]|uniref:Uncharacterized protein n=1 Tax=Portunus trituberculatus TaxID=210409 RepID=A0A5B7CJV8_PORTR|nr:hypothetical protein [Portunus trituberculatus]
MHQYEQVWQVRTSEARLSRLPTAANTEHRKQRVEEDSHRPPASPSLHTVREGSGSGGGGGTSSTYKSCGQLTRKLTSTERRNFGYHLPNNSS